MASASPRSSPRKRNPEKAAAILDGALQEFKVQGYAAASMDRIATAAGVSKPTLYNYFQDKEGLFTALIQHLSQDNPLQQLQKAHPVLSKIPPETFFRFLATTLLKKFQGDQPQFTLIRLIIGESDRFPELAQTFLRHVQKPILETLTEYIAAHPQLTHDPEVMARMFMGTLMHYTIIQEILHGREIMPLERDRLVDGLVTTLLGKKDG